MLESDWIVRFTVNSTNIVRAAHRKISRFDQQSP